MRHLSSSSSSQPGPVPARDLAPVLLLIGILLIATSLRAPITGLAPVLALIQQAFDLSTARAGLLTTLPLLAFSRVSPVAPALARHQGLARTLFGFGACIILALMFMGLCTADPRQAAALSGMAQCVGYLLAAFGPPLVGALRDTSQGWTLPLTFCLVLSLAMAVPGMLAGRKRCIPSAAAPVRA